MNVYDNMKALDITLPEPPAKGGMYSPCNMAGGMAYISGCGCNIGDDIAAGRIGSDFTLEEGQALARRSMLNVLAVLQRAVGDLNRVRPVKILVFVSSDNDFFRQSDVANGASGLLYDLFGGEEGLPARSAIGVNVLPGNLPVEIEAIFSVD